MEKKFGKQRIFLNPKDGVAAASSVARVVDNIKSKNIRWPSIEAECSIELSDCNRQISLEFGLWLHDTKRENVKEIKELRAKLKRLQDLVNNFADATNVAYDYVEARLDAYHKARKIYEANEKKNE